MDGALLPSIHPRHLFAASLTSPPPLRGQERSRDGQEGHREVRRVIGGSGGSSEGQEGQEEQEEVSRGAGGFPKLL